MARLTPDAERAALLDHHDALDRLEMLVLPSAMDGDWLAAAFLQRIFEHRANLIEVDEL